jgi:hypothetical protein
MLSNVVKKDKSSKIIENCITQKIKAGINDLDSEVFYSSDITKCDRRIIYKAIGTPHETNVMKELHDEYIVKKWVQIFNDLRGIEVVDTGTLVADHNYNLTDKIHFVINVDGAVAVIMVQEVSSELFKRGTSRNHIISLMSQMWMAEVNDGFLVYENVDSKEFSVYHVTHNISVLNSVKSKCKDLQEKKMLGILPERKYDDISNDECSSCEFKEKCW